MAGLVQKITADVTGGVSGSRQLTVTATTTTGNMISLWVRASAGDKLTAVSDTHGNTWTVDKTGGSAATTVSLASCILATALLPGDLITVTMNGTHNNECGAAEFTGLLATAGNATPDQAATAHVTTGGAVTVATVVNAAVGGELALTCAGGSVASAACTVTAADPVSGGTWSDLASPAGGGGDAAWQAGPAGLTGFSAAWVCGTTNADAIVVTYRPVTVTLVGDHQPGTVGSLAASTPAATVAAGASASTGQAAGSSPGVGTAAGAQAAVTGAGSAATVTG
jgi:hypothetical protein